MAAGQGPDPFTGDILVVDDEVPNLQLLTQLLSGAGYRVRPARGSRLALDSARAQPPGLILLDVRMPEMDGFEVCRRLKQDDRTRDVPIIFVSALRDAQERVREGPVGAGETLGPNTRLVSDLHAMGGGRGAIPKDALGTTNVVFDLIRQPPVGAIKIGRPHGRERAETTFLTGAASRPPRRQLTLGMRSTAVARPRTQSSLKGPS